MTNEDLQQISNLLDQKLKQAFEENNKNLVTKDDLKEAFIENNKNLVTKDDLKENNKNLVTKDYLDEKFESFRLETCEFINQNVLEGIENSFQKHLDPINLEIKEIKFKVGTGQCPVPTK